ncbi:hypothetical protein Glove_143g53 [Diversispora epigaea]|uniref:Protein kinase domain-containing protein n=1 Tax=Diversispora epigaea TaxID=1348612 RepID=A0A397J411_9GLOM|nr:hypothetical protein Glove_143g53 [Diversispora epigaea]
MTNYVEDYFNQRQQSFSDSSEEEEESVDLDIDYSDDDWQWEERLRLINEFSNWTSGNDNLDQFIQQTQLETPDPRLHVQWIPFENFSDIKFVAEGGYSTVFSATWLNKQDKVWDGAKQTFVKKPLVVALKALKNSKNLSDEFIDEFKRHASIKLDGYGSLVHCHGVTRNPTTLEYLMVMNYAEEGDLRQYIQRNINSLSWKDIIEILSNITMGLINIHKNGTFHKNLHCGNVLKFFTCNIADFGLCGPSDPSEPKGIYGSLPFTAPEVLAGNPFTTKADIYSLGFIMWELSTGIPPFSDRPHDHSLALEICHGFRESNRSGIPPFYKHLMARCWDADPSKRPDAEEIMDILLSPYEYHCKILDIEISKSEINQIEMFDTILASKIIKSNNNNNNGKIHPFAIYTSRLLLYPNLPEPRNRPEVTTKYHDDDDEDDEESEEEGYEEYNTNYPPPPESLESPESSDSEFDEYIPPPIISMQRRKSIVSLSMDLAQLSCY